MRFVQVTYCQGKPFAAYLYLDRRPDDRSVRTEPHGSWNVDYATDGRAIGVEFTSVAAIDLAALNQVLAATGQATVSGVDLAPMKAA